MQAAGINGYVTLNSKYDKTVGPVAEKLRDETDTTLITPEPVSVAGIF